MKKIKFYDVGTVRTRQEIKRTFVRGFSMLPLVNSGKYGELLLGMTLVDDVKEKSKHTFLLEDKGKIKSERCFLKGGKSIEGMRDAWVCQL